MRTNEKILFSTSLLGSLITILSLLIFIENISKINEANKIFSAILVAAVILTEQFAVYQDIKDRMVCDIIHYLALIITIIIFIVNGSNFSTFDYLEYAFPLMFIILTSRMQGFSDTMLMVLILLVELALGMPAGYALLSQTVSYLLGLNTKITQKIKKNIHPVAYIPYLLFGFEIIILIYFRLRYPLILLLFLSVFYAVWQGMMTSRNMLTLRQKC